MPLKTNETEYLLHLVVCALKGERAQNIEGVDFCTLFEIAKEQEIFNLINDVVQSSDFVDDKAKALFKNQTMSEKSKMIALGAQRKIIYEKLSENKIAFMPLKGLIFKDYYPKESMRQMSDNDILIDETKREKAAEIMKGLGYKPFDTTQNSDDFFKEPFYTFELHRSLFDDESEFSPRFGDVWQNAERDKENEFLYHMNKNDVYIYSVCHMFKHYIKCCCGIRFLVDNYLFLLKEEKNLDWEYIYSQLEKNSLLEYEKQTRNLVFKVFENRELSPEEKSLLKNYTDFGIYGSGEGKILQTYLSVSQGNSESGAQFKYILRRLFPSRKDMLFNYPFLDKKPWLTPFMLVHRFFKGLFNIRKTRAELESVKKIKKEN